MAEPSELRDVLSKTLSVDEGTISEFLQAWLEHKLLPDEEQAILERYYSSYVRSFPQRIRRHYDRQTEEIMALIRTLHEPSVLEVGCGCGTESLWMALHGARVRAIDVKPDRLRVAAARRDVLAGRCGTALVCGFERLSVLDLAEEAAYDIVWMEQAFHHLEPRAAVLDKLARLVVPGGHIIISEANALNPLLQLSLFAKRGLKTIKTYTDELGHQRLYGDERVITARALRVQLERRGIRTRDVRHFRVFPNHAMFDAMGGLEASVPSWLRPAFTHYNYVGQRPGPGSS